MKEVEKNIDSKKEIDEIDKFNSDDDNQFEKKFFYIISK